LNLNDLNGAKLADMPMLQSIRVRHQPSNGASARHHVPPGVISGADKIIE
jgi:hypothetical protein